MLCLRTNAGKCFLFPLRYKENEKLPELVKEKLHCLSSILSLLASPAVRRWRALNTQINLFIWSVHRCRKHFCFFTSYTHECTLSVCKYIFLNICTYSPKDYEKIYFYVVHNGLVFVLCIQFMCSAFIFVYQFYSALQWNVSCTNIHALNICCLVDYCFCVFCVYLELMWAGFIILFSWFTDNDNILVSHSNLFFIKIFQFLQCKKNHMHKVWICFIIK